MSPLAQKTLETAIAEIGQHEDPPGSNSSARIQVYQDWIGKQFEGQAWCCCFALWCAAHAAHALGVESRLPKVASTSELYRWYLHNGRLFQRPTAGCIGMLRGGSTGHHHTFLVESVQGDHVESIDGNWGNAVKRTSHPIHSCDFGPIL